MRTAALLLALAGLLAACGSSVQRVTVPRAARYRDLAGAYRLLRAAGFRVALSRPVEITSLDSPGAAALSPRAGTEAARGSTVTIEPTSGGPLGSPAVGRSGASVVPSFVGRRASVAVAWANGHGLFWAIPRLPALSGSTAPTLFGAYRVVAQSPPAGRLLRPGVMVGRGFRPTPLTLRVVAVP